ncbi:helix-turn-helix transcriptional regulator [Flavihumibacter sp. CACIAM 22H1]|uniref:helix-turn-helix domain-containing protein n=1 Tax=Flavihumibacter sp. CACIAM 22H1 TaxID=1812911 RepID=UPI0007A90AB3|nr:helix-turn-helix transcriptional regulator [Flavihumibacter sp. CACIAM 22H1]KYP16639.1 MAG: hypothetical protein A1D16_09515 [Flavihumibacter sp. CACIAM 22H1]
MKRYSVPKKINSSIADKIIEETPDYKKIEIKHSIDFTQRLVDLVNEKFDGKQKLLAECLGKTEAQISKWFSGTHNFTFRTVSKIEAACGVSILAIRSEAPDTNFVQACVGYMEEQKDVVVDSNGKIFESNALFVPVTPIGENIETKLVNLPS